MKHPTYSIGDVASMTGVTRRQIRNWESRGYIPEADRVVSGSRAYRRFSLHQIELISTIKALLDEGFTLPAAAEKATNRTLQPRKESTPGGQLD
ncbi:MAG: MerR family transcriptional regulator [Desulfobacteraceae bacterium]|nr:MerR family transcriptional regulator [Desulfobacteraceae bacterium]MBC2752579.1 MerR family transcriptional regulator [Desulfobacteraceae bacterium]